jgi:hypothetical protein
MEPRYDILFGGEVQAGLDPAEVRDRLAALFKASDAAMARLFSGDVVPVKRNVDKPTAARYRVAMHKAGAVAIIRKIDPASTETDQTAGTEPPEQDGLTLAETGAELLREEERPRPEAVEVDVSHIALANAFQVPEPAGHEHPPPPDTSHLDVAAAGETIPNLRPEQEPVNPDTSHLTMGDVGESIPTLPDDNEPLNPDTSALSVAETGSDILEDRFRRREDASAPDTDHLELEEES